MRTVVAETLAHDTLDAIALDRKRCVTFGNGDADARGRDGFCWSIATAGRPRLQAHVQTKQGRADAAALRQDLPELLWRFQTVAARKRGGVV